MIRSEGVPGGMGSQEALYIISVAARLVRLHPNTLRKYERAGFLVPSRTIGNLRLYSHEDIARLRQIKYLVENLGVNLAGVELALELTQDIRELQDLIDDLSIPEIARRRLEQHLGAMLRTLGTSLE